MPDDLDIQILRALGSPQSFQWDIRISYARVAEGLGVDEETVRNRLDHMTDVKFLIGWQLIPNPALLGREAAIVELRVTGQGTKRDLITQLKAMEGVILIDDFYGRELAVLTFFGERAALERHVQLFASLCHSPPPLWWKLGFPPCDLTPTATDWRIIQSLRESGRSKLLDLARRLGLSTRTVERRLIRLIEGNAFYLDPVLDLRKAAGIRGRFWVTAEASRKRAVDEAILGTLRRTIFTHMVPEENSLFVAHFSNTAQLDEALRWMRSLEGVKDVRSAIEVEHIQVHDWLEGEIERRLTDSKA
jgi:DNA-binding Lrp family transcriptional regulator